MLRPAFGARFALLLLCAAAPGRADLAQAKAVPDPQLDQWVASSNLVFEVSLSGPAKAKGEFDEFHDPAASVVGKIAKVLELPATPPLAKDLEGAPVTLFLDKPDKALTGQLVVFGTLEAAGEGVAVQLVGAVAGPAAEVAPRLKAAVERWLLAQLQARLNSCDAVVLASVTRLVPEPALPDESAPEPTPNRTKGSRPQRENDPAWREAELTAEAWLLGAGDKKPLPVRFASSAEEPWQAAPHPAAGEKKIWLLGKTRRAPGSTADYVLRSALDPGQRTQVEALLKKRVATPEPQGD
jgi:hypothetical protein